MPARRCLADTRVLCVGVSEDLLPKLRCIVRELGGSWQEQVVAYDLPHVLVTTTVCTDQYKVLPTSSEPAPARLARMHC